MSLDHTGRGGGVLGGYVPLFPDMRHALLMCHLGVQKTPEPRPAVPQWNHETCMSHVGRPRPHEPMGDRLGDKCDDHNPFSECDKFTYMVLKLQIHPRYCNQWMSNKVFLQRQFVPAPHWMLLCDVRIDSSATRWHSGAACLLVDSAYTETVADIHSNFQKAAPAQARDEVQARYSIMELQHRNHMIKDEICALQVEASDNKRRALCCQRLLQELEAESNKTRSPDMK